MREIVVPALLGALGFIAVMHSHQTRIVADDMYPLTNYQCKISVIVSALNEEKLIEQALLSIHNQNIIRDNPQAFEIITVVDERTTDRTAEIARRYSEVIASPPGKLSAKNCGAMAATGDLLFFIDADTDPPPNLLNLMLRHFNNPDVVAVGSVMMFGEGWMQAGCALMNTFYFPSIKKLIGNATVIRKDAFMTIGGYNTNINQFDRREMVYWEEIAPSLELQKIGVVVVDTEATVFMTRTVNPRLFGDHSDKNYDEQVLRGVRF